MTMLQHYYTSCSNGVAGGVGFQCKAMSPNIRSEDIKTINNLIGYRIPSSLVDAPIDRHPIALRYEYLDRDKCILLCSQSNGNDENGRPGNFFAHSVITSPQDFDVFPPIMFWRSPFWVSCDDSTRLELPVLSAFEESPSLDFQQVWSFLESEERKSWFYKLLSAVISYGRTKRSIVILDDVDNIAMWIMATTVALPQIYRQYITFATYHHDPYQVPFLITGTTTDSRFRFSSDEYISFFILNTYEKRISDVEDSIYTQFILKNFTPDLYERKLLEFFEMCNSRLPADKPANMEAALSSIAKFYMTIRDKTLALPDIHAYEGLKLFIRYTESIREIYPSDLDDLVSTVDLLGKQVSLRPEIPIVQDYGSALRQLKRLHPNYAGHAKEDLLFLANLALNGNEDVVKSLLATYSDVYHTEILSNVISQVDYLSYLHSKAPRNQLVVHLLIWKYLLPFARVDASTKIILTELLKNSLSTIREKYIQGDPDIPSPEADQLLDAVIGATNNNQKFLLEIGQSLSNDDIRYPFNWLYYKLVCKVALAERKPYRNIVSTLIPQLLVYEIRRDVRFRGISNIIQTLEEWIDHTTDYSSDQTLIVTQGLDAIWKSLPPERRIKTSEVILLNPKILQQLNQVWVSKLLLDYFSLSSFQNLGQSSQTLFEKYINWPNLSIEQRGMIGGSLAVSTGKFLEKTVPDIRMFLSRLDAASYEKEAGKLIWRFFSKGMTVDTHLEMLQATYVQQYEAIFWNVYWNYFKQLVLDYHRSKDFVSLLSFWFDDSFGIFSELPYLGQSFFLELSSVLEDLQKEKEFERSAHLVVLEAAKLPWFNLVEQYFTGRKKKRLFGLIGK
jgi:hypothetical protein